MGVPEGVALNPLFLKSASLHPEFMGSMAMAGGIPKNQGGILKEAASMVDAGTLKPHVSKTFALDQLAEAHTLQETQGTTGKLVIKLR